MPTSGSLVTLPPSLNLWEPRTAGVTSGRIGYMKPAVWGSPPLGPKSKLTHKLAECLHNCGCWGGSQRFRAVDKIRNGPRVGAMATKPPPSRGPKPRGGGGGGATPRVLGRQRPLPPPPPSKGPSANSQLPKVSPPGVHGRQRRPMLHEHQRCPKENFVQFAP